MTTERGETMRFLFGVLMLWGAIVTLVLSERIPLPKGLLSGGLFTYLILRRAKDDASFQQWRNRWRRWWACKKFNFKFRQQQTFSQQSGKEKYDIANKGLTEEHIRAWISDEMQKETTQYGLAVDYLFLAEPGEIEDRARKRALSF